MSTNTLPIDHQQAGPNPVLMGFVVGAAVGAGIALLFAPATGAETRRTVGRVANRIRHRVDDTVHDVQKRMSEFQEDFGSAIDSGRKAFSESRHTRDPDANAPSVDYASSRR
jgi:gas vesicle protein